MRIPGYPNYEWNGTEVLNIESGNVLSGNDRRRVNLRNAEGGNVTVTYEEIATLCLTKHPRDIEGIEAAGTPGTWFDPATGFAYQDVDGEVSVLRQTGGGNAPRQVTLWWEGRTRRMALEDFRTQHITRYRSPSKKLKTPAEKKTTKAKAMAKAKGRPKRQKEKEKRVEILSIPGFAYYQLNGESVISSLGSKQRTLEARNGTFVLLSNQEQRCRLTLEEIKELCGVTA